MKLVVDASVTIKWLLDDPAREADTQAATELLAAVVLGEIHAIQPVHWTAEIAAVLARASPATAVVDSMRVQALGIPVCAEPGILRRACELAIETKEHLFDTLYHAVALETPGTELITADERYYAKARRHGHIRLLRDFRPH